MRRAKIRPSINLSASRRSIATPATKSKDSVAPKPDAATPKSGSSSTPKSPTPQAKGEKSLEQEDHLEVEVPPKSEELQEQNQHQEKQQPQDGTKQSPSQQLEPAQPHPAAPKTTHTATPMATPITTPMATPITTPTPRTAPRARLRAIPNLPPRAKPRATPIATPSATPRTTPNTTPGSMPSATPSATPRATPRTTATSRNAFKTSPVTTPNASPNAPPTADHQSTLPAIDKHSPDSGPNPPPESPNKASNVRRKRITAVPNLGQPRLRSSSTSTIKVASRPKVNSTPGKEHDKGTPSLGAGSVANLGAGPETVAKSESKAESMGPPVQPPPIQRVISAKAPTTPTPTKEPSTASSVSPDVPSSHTEAVTTSQTSHTLAVATPQKPHISRSDSEKRSVSSENVYQKKLRELQDRMEAETPSRRRRHYVNSKGPPPERSKMTMSDLIYFNPKTSPMKWVRNQKNTSPNKKKFPQTSSNKQDVGENDSINNSTHNSENEDEVKDEEDVDPFAPRVKIGPDGSLILDSSSLVKDASPAKTLHMDSDVIREEESNTTYSSFRKRTHTTAWNERDTDKFFRALSAVGTDFSMINAMFPKRTRQQIKNKFKREERHNRQRIDKAVTNKTHFDMALFYKESTSESDGTKAREKEEKKKKAKEKRKVAAKKRTKRQKKGTGKGKRRNARKDDDSDNDSDLELSDTEVNSKADDDQISKADAEEISKNEVAVVDSAGEEETREDENARQSDGSEDEVNIGIILGQPTRSGRQPKLRTSFTVEEPKRKPRGPYQGKLNADEDYARKRLDRLEKERNIVLAKKRADRDQFPPYTPGEFVRTPPSSGKVAGVGEEVEGAQVAGEAQAPVVIQNGTVANQEQDRDLTSPQRRGVSTITTPMGRFIVSVPQTSRDREGTPSGPNCQNLTTAASQNRVPRKPIRSHIFVISSPDGKQNIIHVPIQPDNSLPEGNRSQSSAPSASAPRFRNPMTTPRIMLKTTVRNPQQTPTIRVRQMNMTRPQNPAMSPSNSPLILMNSQARRAAQASQSPQQSPNSLKRKQSHLEPFVLQPVSGSNKIIIMSPQAQAQTMSSSSRTSNSGVPTRVAYVPVGKQGTEKPHHHEQVVSFQNQGGNNPESHLTFEVNRTNPPTSEPTQKVSHMTSDMSTDWLLRDETVGHEVDIPSSELEEEEVAETEEAFVPPSSNVRQSPPADNGRDQVMGGHVTEEQLTAQEILEQLAYEEGVEDDVHVGANMEVGINNEEIITQIATEMIVE